MLTIHRELIQGSDEWLAARRGMLTASEIKLIVTPKTLKCAANDKVTSHLYELAAQRVTDHVEPSFISDDMLRGIEDEPHARDIYAEHFHGVEPIGFVTNDKWGFTLGASPDGFVGDEGMIEVKSPRQKKQLETIVTGEVPEEHILQIQTGLLVTERQWCDFISYHGGMHMAVIRVFADATIQAAIVDAAATFYSKLDDVIQTYFARVAGKGSRLIPTQRRTEQEITV